MWLGDQIGVWPFVGQMASTEARGAPRQVDLDPIQLPFEGSQRPISLPFSTFCLTSSEISKTEL